MHKYRSNTLNQFLENEQLFLSDLPWFWEHQEMDAGILFGENPALEVTEVLKHVLSEEGGEGGHHARHQVHHRTQGLH